MLSFFLFQIANIYFDASLQCGDHCYVGLPFVLKCKSFLFFFLCFPTVCSLKHLSAMVMFAAEVRPHTPAMLEDIWDSDVDLHQRLLKRWKELKEQSGLE